MSYDLNSVNRIYIVRQCNRRERWRRERREGPVHGYPDEGVVVGPRVVHQAGEERS